jgi:hypothetical protein
MSSLNAKLTLEQKQIIIGVNHFTTKFNNKIQDESYGDDAAYTALDRWISEIIGVDFRKSVYNDKRVGELNRVDRIKYGMSGKFGAWFIGDGLMNEMYSLVVSGKSEASDIQLTESKIKTMWEYFKDIAGLNQPQYEPAMIVDGVQLYKKVESGN